MMLVQHRSGDRVTSELAWIWTERTASDDGFEPAGGRAAEPVVLAGGRSANDSLHDVRARLKISSQ